ncbi:MAG: fibronectin type III domain-containing protein [Pseudomonadales bacterium]|nr:fibronectin type III domain-containing protein [Pseudomonadales bacterium]
MDSKAWLVQMVCTSDGKLKWWAKKRFNAELCLIQSSTPNTLPVIVITSPQSYSNGTTVDPIVFQAIATDQEDGDISQHVRWKSSIDGSLTPTAVLSPGNHIITATISDSAGAKASDSITLSIAAPVVNTPPEIAILKPESSTELMVGQSIALKASAHDVEDGDISSQVLWTSSIDGKIVDGATLSEGRHQIKASVVDGHGLSAYAYVLINVQPKPTNTLPTITIASPTDQTSIVDGDSLVLVASATDTEDGVLTPAIRWTSSLDGELESPALLSVGRHHLVAAVADSAGSVSLDSVWVTVVAKPVNTPPTINIRTPVSNVVIEEGESIELDAVASDQEDGDLSSQIAWFSSIDGAITHPVLLTVGMHEVSAQVRDSEGALATARVSVTVEQKAVNTVPTLSITAPSTDTVLEEGNLLTLAAVATDTEDGDLSNEIKWTSSLDGVLSNPALLSVGYHEIEAEVVDSEGALVTAIVRVTIEPTLVNTAPTVRITSPAENSVFEEGVMLNLVAVAYDEDEGDLSESVTWVSSLDGEIDSRAELSVGSHEISATVVDSSGSRVSAYVQVTIEPKIENTPPVITISSPADGLIIEEGFELMFQGDAYDEEDGDLTDSILWASSLDGSLSNFTTLTVGEHLITASVSDSEGLSASMQLTLVVTEKTDVADALTLSWDLPRYRSNGSPLDVAEIGGYELTFIGHSSGEVVVIELIGSNSTSFPTSQLSPDSYTFTMRSFDREGLYSESTLPVEIDVP